MKRLKTQSVQDLMKSNVITLLILQITQSWKDLSEIEMIMLMIVQKIQNRRDLMKIDVKMLMIMMKIKKRRRAWWTSKKAFQRLAEWSWVFIALQNFSLTHTFLSMLLMYVTVLWHKRRSKIEKSIILISFMNSDWSHSIIFSHLNLKSLQEFNSFLNAFEKRLCFFSNTIILSKRHLTTFSYNEYIDFTYFWLQDLKSML